MEIGQVAKGREIGYKNPRLKYVWAACESCGKERWEQLVNGEPKCRRCNSCRQRHDIDIQEVTRLYCEEKLSLVKVAQKVGSSELTVWRRLKQLGLTRSPKEARGCSVKRGPESPSWRGGKFKQGAYNKVWQPDHPRANKQGYVYEHILVWEEAHGKPLPQGWVVHHINGVKDDNRPRNLLALPKGKHHSKMLLQEAQKRIRELQIENRQLQRAFEDSQMIFYISEN